MSHSSLSIEVVLLCVRGCPRRCAPNLSASGVEAESLARAEPADSEIPVAAAAGTTGY